VNAPWTVLIPVKPAGRAKRRLRGVVAAGHHAALVRAMALDTITAALAASSIGAVVLVTADDSLATQARRLGAAIVGDAGALNVALREAADAVRRPPDGVAALLADLPAVRVAELDGALDFAGSGHGLAFLADAAGTGTTLLAAPPGVAFTPRFGRASAAAHSAIARPLQEPPTGWPGLRTDVDTPDDLKRALELGVGPHTAVLLGNHFVESR